MNFHVKNRAYRVLAPLTICAALALSLQVEAEDADWHMPDELAAPPLDAEQSLDLSLPETDPAEIEPLNIELTSEESPVRTFVDDCLELDAVPLFELSDSEQQRVFFGVDFDGTLGIHVRQ